MALVVVGLGKSAAVSWTVEVVHLELLELLALWPAFGSESAAAAAEVVEVFAAVAVVVELFAVSGFVTATAFAPAAVFG